MRRIFLALTLTAAGLVSIRADNPAAAAGSPYASEQDWIVATICRNAFELLSYDKDKTGIRLTPAQVIVKDEGGAVPTFDVAINAPGISVQATLPLSGSIWDESSYEPFCKAAAQALKVTPSGSATSQGNPLHTLLDYTDAAVEEENQRVSQWLNAEPGNAAAHEQAALVLGMLAMRENSGFYWDPREMCSRACAHLAVAQFLRPDTLTPEGGWATVLVGLIADTKAETGRQIDALAAAKNPSPNLADWVTATRMRNSRDWRLSKSPETATPFEQVEYFRALGEATNSDKAVTWMTQNNVPARIDWARIAMEEGFSVDTGHELVADSINAEIKNMIATLPAQIRGAHLIEDLNIQPGDVLGTDGHLTVIDRGMWAHYFQRHLCNAIVGMGDYFKNKWGVPENADALDKVVNKDFSGLDLFASLQVFNAQMRGTPADPVAAAGLVTAHPEWVTYSLLIASDRPALAQTREKLTRWFQPPMLPGTAYCAFLCMPAKSTPREVIDRAFVIAPLQFHVAELKLKEGDGHFTTARAREILGPLLDYYTPAIELAQGATDVAFDQKVELLKKSAAIDPDKYYDLGLLYLDSHQDEQAAAAIQEWHDKETDRVEVSDNIDWLVNYYFDHGQKDQALAIAQEAADVYSSDGLRTMMCLQDRMGRTADAESYGQKIEERYNDKSALAALYLGHVTKGETAYQSKLDAVTKDVFPAGLKPVTLASFSTPPNAGVRFTQTNDVLAANGLSPSQIVVSLDGYATNNQQQYLFIRNLSESSDMHFIVWDGHAYRAITAHRHTRQFGIPLQDYHG